MANNFPEVKKQRYIKRDLEVEPSYKDSGYTEAAHSGSFAQFGDEKKNNRTMKNINGQIRYVKQRKLMQQMVDDERNMLLGGSKKMVKTEDELDPHELPPPYVVQYSPLGNRELNTPPTPGQTLVDEETHPKLPNLGGEVAAETGFGSIDVSPGTFSRDYDYSRSAIGHEFQHAKDYEDKVSGHLASQIEKAGITGQDQDKLVGSLMEIRAYQSELNLADTRGLNADEKKRISDLQDRYLQGIPDEQHHWVDIALNQIPLISDSVAKPSRMIASGK